MGGAGTEPRGTHCMQTPPHRAAHSPPPRAPSPPANRSVPQHRKGVQAGVPPWPRWGRGRLGRTSALLRLFPQLRLRCHTPRGPGQPVLVTVSQQGLRGTGPWRDEIRGLPECPSFRSAEHFAADKLTAVNPSPWQTEPDGVGRGRQVTGWEAGSTLGAQSRDSLNGYQKWRASGTRDHKSRLSGVSIMAGPSTPRGPRS